MRIRTKFLILLLVIALVPLLFVSWNNIAATRNLGLRLVERGYALVVKRFSKQLRQTVDYSAAVMRQQKKVVELALEFQAMRAEAQLASRPKSRGKIYFATHYDTRGQAPPDLKPSTKHKHIRAGGKTGPSPISLREQVIFLPQGVSAEKNSGDISILMGMTPTYRHLYKKHEGLFFWLYTSLKSGVHSSYPGHGGYPAGYDPRKRSWYQLAQEVEGLVWSPPYVDAPTRQVLLTASTPIRWPDGSFAGVTSIDVQILSILQEAQLRSSLSKAAQTFLIDLAPQKNKSLGLRVIAHRDYERPNRNWNAPLQIQWLGTGAPKGVQRLIQNMKSGKTDLIRMPYRGKDSFWAYKPIDELDNYLLFIAPFDDALAGFRQARSIIGTETLNQIQVVALVSLAMLIAVGVASVFSSRSITAPLRSLASAAGRIAEGDFKARAEVRSRDELGELAQSFNAMIPHLEDRMRVRQSLATAMEVQQNLLPAGPPEMRGFDIAGLSFYCDETGGDYYDFIDLTDAVHHRVGIAVGDVTGHGVAAALLMATVRALLRSRASQPGSLAELFGFINHHLATDARGGHFMTMFYLVIDGEDQTARWVNAGHDSAMIYDTGSDRFEELRAQDIPLGIKPEWQFHEFSAEVNAGHTGNILLIGTDGIWDARNPQGEMFGKESVQEAIRRHKEDSAVEICRAVEKEIVDFRGGGDQTDDITMVVVKAIA